MIARAGNLQPANEAQTALAVQLAAPHSALMNVPHCLQGVCSNAMERPRKSRRRRFPRLARRIVHHRTHDRLLRGRGLKEAASHPNEPLARCAKLLRLCRERSKQVHEIWARHFEGRR